MNVEKRTEDIAGVPSRDELFRLLTEEIRDITEAGKLSGWTPWVIGATLISSAWVVIQDIWTGLYKREVVVAVFVVLSLARVLISSVRRLDRNPVENGKRVRFIAINSEAEPSELLFAMFRYGVTAWCVSDLSRLGNKLVFSSAAIVLAYYAIVSGIVALTLVARLPISSPHPSSGHRWLTVLSVLFIMPGYLLYAMVVAQVIQSGVISSGSDKDLRIGGILAISMVGIGLLARRNSSERKQQKELAAIRREIVLGSISTSEAHQRTRVALQGLWVSDLVKEETGRLLALISAATKEHELALFNMRALKTGVDLSAPVLSDLDRLTFSSVMEMVAAHKIKSRERSREYFRLLNKVLRRLTVMAKLAPGAASDKISLLREIQSAQAPVDRLLEAVEAEYDDLLRAWNARFPTT